LATDVTSWACVVIGICSSILVTKPQRANCLAFLRGRVIVARWAIPGVTPMSTFAHPFGVSGGIASM